MNVVNVFCVDEHYTNDQIRFSLGLENLGGIRPSVNARKNLQHLAIMTTAEESGRLLSENPYYDRIEGDILTYTAQGREGDQQLIGRNKRLLEQYSVPLPFFGFINVGKQVYRFLGLLELLRHYQEIQTDIRGVVRKVWIFEFKIHREPQSVEIANALDISSRIIVRDSLFGDLERQVENIDKNIDDKELSIIEGVRRNLVQINPYHFEHLVKSLMELNGFRDVCVTVASGDGGIDINAYADDSLYFFSETHVQAQVKRWRHAIGNVDINNFRGALSSTAKGVFITTSHYTRAAIVEAQHASKLAITLIDGIKLSSMILKSNLNLDKFNSQENL
jgi:restriction endonuclease Mrr